MKIDWMWLIIGLALGWLVLPMLLSKFGGSKAKGATATR
jgi:hypothetical protein